MNLNEFFEKILFTIGEFNITSGNLILTLLALGVVVLADRLIIGRWLPAFAQAQELEKKESRRIAFLINSCCILIGLLAIVLIPGLNYVLYSNDQITFSIATLLQTLLVLQASRLTDRIFSGILLHGYQKRRKEERLPAPGHPVRPAKEEGPVRMVQYLVYALALFLIINSFKLNFTIFSYTLNDKSYDFTLSHIFLAVLILMIARTFVWILINLLLYPYYQRKNIHVGSQYAINQLLKYLIFFIAVLAALDTMGLNLTVVWGGAAALLLGIGLGLQQTFNDFFSGLILLFERTVEVGDVVDINGLVGTVRKIGLRTSLILTRENISVVVPNSKLVVDNVINWSHNDNKARFHVSVGVAYGSDTALVQNLLLEAARSNEKVLRYPAPFVRFVDFGNSSLDFELHFWSREFIMLEDVKSQLRLDIDRLFRENHVTIPFPQRDVWIRKES